MEVGKIEWKGGGKTVTVEDITPAPADVWRLTWGLDVFREPPEGIPVLESPDVNCFRVRFRTEDEAIHFKAEVQRYLGDLLMRLADDVMIPRALEDIRGLFTNHD